MTTKTMFFPLADCTYSAFIQYKRKTDKGGAALEVLMKKIWSQVLKKNVKFTLMGKTALKVS